MPRNKIFLVVLASFIYAFGQPKALAQVVDVYFNKAYDYGSYILKEEIDKAYVPSQMENIQDRIKNDDINTEEIEDKLRDLAIKQIENEVSYFEIQNMAVNYLKNYNQLNRLIDPYFEEVPIHPVFKNLEIKLLSVSSRQGVYCLQYNFDKVKVKKYYIADLLTSKVAEIAQQPNKVQQKHLKDLSLATFTAYYLIKTKKLSLRDLDRIRATQLGKEQLDGIAQRINYAEAEVYPYYDGLMVSFPAHSESSEIFENQAFRTLVRGEDLQQLLTVYPSFKTVFNNTLKRPSKAIREKLDDDQNFSLTKFERAPKELDLLETITLSAKDKSLFSLSITNYQKSDTIKRFLGSKKIFFNKNKDVERIEYRDDRHNIVREEKYEFDDKMQITSFRTQGHGNKLQLYHYQNQQLQYIEKFELNDYQTAWGRGMVDLSIWQEHYVYNGKHRYNIHFNVVGDLDPNRRYVERYLKDQNYCTNNFCLLIDDEGNVMGVKQKSGAPMDILFNANHQPMETYVDNDRYIYRFTYDDQARIKTYTSDMHGEQQLLIIYDYLDSLEKPLRICETSFSNGKSIMLQEYELIHWEN